MNDSCIRLQLYEHLEADIYENLAMEEYLMNHIRPQEAALFLWSNAPVVVIGRNQNPHKECELEKMREDHIRLARRKSGGGAVYQDEGNLNFSYICQEPQEPLEILEHIISFLEQYGIYTELSGRNDIVLKDSKYKISGVAARQQGSHTLVHGTLLIDVNLDHMQTYLRVSDEKLKGLPSVKSRVMNLSALRPMLTVEEVKDGLLNYFLENESYCARLCPLPIDREFLTVLKNEYASQDWIYGTPFSYNYTKHGRFDWGEMTLSMQLHNYKIGCLRLYSDALVPELIQQIEEQCLGQKLSMAGDRIDELFEQISHNKKRNHEIGIMYSEETFDRMRCDIKRLFY